MDQHIFYLICLDYIYKWLNNVLTLFCINKEAYV